MTITRRDIALLLPALAVVSAQAEEPVLPSKAYRFEDLPVRANGANVSRAILNGATHSGFPIESHLTEIAAGLAPHPPHHHIHEELILIVEGTMEFTVNGKSTKLGPGSVAYAASNDEHGLRNTSDTRARYFVVALGPRQAN